MNYCTDTDLLHWEPNLFQDAAPVAQTLLAGTGSLDGVAFTLDAGSLADARVSPGHVVRLTGGIDGAFPVVAVPDDTHLTLSVLHDTLYPDDGDPLPAPVGVAAGLAFAVRTFGPQAKVVSDLLRRAAGIDAAHVVTDPAPLRRACVLGTLHMVYVALAAPASPGESARLLIRARLYERLFAQALRSTRVELDTNNDGRPDDLRRLGEVRLERA